MIKNALLLAVALVLTGFAAPEAVAGPGHGHRHHHRHHFFPRAVLFAPLYAAPLYYRPAPAYYPPAPAYYPPAPVQYIEQPAVPQAGVAPQLYSGAYWYCPSSGGYYPAVPSCPGPWTRVPPPPG